MSQRDKRKKRLKAVPADYTWNEVVAILSDFGYREVKSSGSHRGFYNEVTKKTIIGLFKPHGRGSNNTIPRNDLRRVIRHLGL